MYDWEGQNNHLISEFGYEGEARPTILLAQIPWNVPWPVLNVNVGVKWFQLKG